MTTSEALLMPSVIEVVCLITLVVISRKTGWIKEPAGDAVLGTGCAFGFLGIIYAAVTGYMAGVEQISYSVFGGFAIAFGISVIGYTAPGIIGIYTDPTLRRKAPESD